LHEEEHQGHLIVPTVDYRAGRVRIIDQTLLPGEERILELGSIDEVAEAIRNMRVRGAPAIGLVAAYGVLLAVESLCADANKAPRFDRLGNAAPFDPSGIGVQDIRRRVHEARELLGGTRPTAANLFWALDRMEQAAADGDEAGRLCEKIAREAFDIHEEELEVEFTIGRNGAPYIHNGMRILTHCNAGGLATAGYGTALAVLYTAHEEGKRFHVYAGETRPLLQGARLTVWELTKHGIDVTLLCDNAAASLFADGGVDVVMVGADRIARNGDTANKIGTFGLAVLCEKFSKPLYVAAPWSTFDLTLDDGSAIPIEQRDPTEVTYRAGLEAVPAGATVYNPAFDVTPAGLITAIITERGVIERPDAATIEAMAPGGGNG
jgi:methylthioribose-1-phosphate isomerase